MNSERLDLGFIDRAITIFEPIDNRLHFNLLQKKYFSTAKGKVAQSIGDFKRRSRMKAAAFQISKEERRLIGEFYKDCPQDYEVDHIIAVSRGGRHCMSNLQYLTLKENRKKWKN